MEDEKNKMKKFPLEPMAAGEVRRARGPGVENNNNFLSKSFF